MGNRSEKTNVKKSRKMIFAVIVFFLVVSMGLISYLSGFHIDLSQKYRSIEDYENIIFKDSWDNQCYRLWAWGLVKTEDAAEFEDHRDPDTSSYEYRLLVEKAGAEWIEQIVPSPNGKYILYVERIYRTRHQYRRSLPLCWCRVVRGSENCFGLECKRIVRLSMEPRKSGSMGRLE